MYLTRRKFSIHSGAALLTGLSTAQAQTEGKIILGQSAAFTGPAAQLGIQFYQGAKVYFDQVNAQGGIGRQQIEIRQLDDGYEPTRCVENTKKLIASDVFASCCDPISEGRVCVFFLRCPPVCSNPLFHWPLLFYNGFCRIVSGNIHVVPAKFVLNLPKQHNILSEPGMQLKE